MPTRTQLFLSLSMWSLTLVRTRLEDVHTSTVNAIETPTDDETTQLILEQYRCHPSNSK